MKKKIAMLLLAACIFTACGGKSPITTGNQPLADAVYSNDQISLAPYTDLKAEKKNYIITEETIENAVHEALLEFADYKSVSRPSESGDVIYVDFKSSVDGSVSIQEDDYQIILGAAEFGKEFDQKLTGVSAGDQLDFSLDYDSDFTDVEWAGNTVDFELTVKEVQEKILPEITDSFIKENTEYSTYDEYTDSIRQSVADTYEAESTSELQEDLIQQVIDASSILQYTQEEYDEAREVIEGGYMGYVDMFGFEDLDALYKAFEMTQEDVEEEIQTKLYRNIVVDAIIQNENLSLSDQDYEDGVAYYMEQNGYESKSEFLSDFSEDEVRSQLLEDKVLNFLVNHADITETDAEYEED